MSIPSIRVCLVEDDRATREGMVELLTRSPDIECLAAYAQAEQACRCIPQVRPEVVLMDINLGGASGISCVARLKRDHPEILFVMLTTYDDSRLIFDSLRAGASGYVLKRSPVAEIIAAVQEVHRGGSPMSMQIARKVVSHFHAVEAASSEMETLTIREREVLSLLAEGEPYKRIADRLGISEGVVRNRLHGIYAKLHVQSRTEAVVKYLAEG